MTVRELRQAIADAPEDAQVRIMKSRKSDDMGWLYEAQALPVAASAIYPVVIEATGRSPGRAPKGMLL